MVSRETLFNDLPQGIKQKIINIRNIASLQPAKSSPAPLKDLGNSSIPSCQPLRKTFMALCEASQSLKPTNVEAALAAEVTELKAFIEAYKSSIECRDFVGEFEKTIQQLEARYKKLKQ